MRIGECSCTGACLVATNASETNTLFVCFFVSCVRVNPFGSSTPDFAHVYMVLGVCKVVFVCMCAGSCLYAMVCVCLFVLWCVGVIVFARGLICVQM